jgi:hypothetical protein
VARVANIANVERGTTKHPNRRLSTPLKPPPSTPPHPNARHTPIPAGMAPPIDAEDEDEDEGEAGAAPSPPAFSVLHDKALAVERVALCPKMDLAAVLMADGAWVDGGDTHASIDRFHRRIDRFVRPADYATNPTTHLVIIIISPFPPFP